MYEPKMSAARASQSRADQEWRRFDKDSAFSMITPDPMSQS